MWIMFAKDLLSKRLSCSRKFELEERLDDYHELDTRHNEIKEGDIVEINNGVYHIEVTAGLENLIKEAESYVEDYSDSERVSMYINFLRKFCISDRSTKFDYNFYVGRALNMNKLLENECLNSTDAAVLLSIMLNSDKELKKQGFKAYCVSGYRFDWRGRLYGAVAVKLGSNRQTFLVTPSENKVENITGIALPASLSGGYTEVYESMDSAKVVMLVNSSKLYRKKPEEDE